MSARRAATPSAARLFMLHAVITLVPVLLLGAVLSVSYRNEANRRGLAEARAQAALLASTAVEPLLEGEPLSGGLTPSERAGLERLIEGSLRDHAVLRLRIRDEGGTVVLSEDGSGVGGEPDHEALEAAGGEVAGHMTRVNSDNADVGPRGERAVEVYLPLTAGTPARQIGVLEVYLPYDPIAHDVESGLTSLYRNLVAGLAALYLALLVVSTSVSRGLRRESATNAFLAEHDVLTGLPNRTYFHRTAAAAIEGAARGHRPFALAIIDLDRFKEVNDTLGHHNGDDLLVELADRLASAAGPGDTIARLGGDEFGVLVADLTDVERTLRSLRDVIDADVEVAGLSISIEASIGYVVAPEDGDDVDDLLQRADVAMYSAKREHGGLVRYNAGLDHYDAANLALLADLRRAIVADELVLHYQPKTTLRDGTTDAVEALVRWEHPVLGLLPPDRFLALAEQTDLIDKLTDWVLNRALHDIGSLGDLDLVVAVNISGRNLASPGFADRVVAALQQAQVSPRRVILEITETALITDPVRAGVVLGQLAAAGVRLSLDDFGRGQTSLSYLSTLPVHELKIDKGFVMDMVDNPGHAAIVRSVVDLGHNLALEVVGEGVESAEALVALRATGCDLVQGFHLARPMTLEALRRWLHVDDAPSELPAGTRVDAQVGPLS